MASQGFGSTENHLWDSWLDLLIQLIVSIGLGLHVYTCSIIYDGFVYSMKEGYILNLSLLF